MLNSFLKLVFLVLVLGWSTYAVAQDLGYDEDNSVVWVGDEDEEINQAMVEARSTIETFWKYKNSGDPDYSEFSLKVALETSTGSLEHIWVNRISGDASAMTGYLGNDPVDLAGLKYGDKVTFSSDQISDWQYFKDDLMYGHYTTRVLLGRMPKEEAAIYASMMGEIP